MTVEGRVNSDAFASMTHGVVVLFFLSPFPGGFVL